MHSASAAIYAIHARLHANIQTCICTLIHVCMYACVRLYVSMLKCMCMQLFACIQSYVHTIYLWHICISLFMYICMHRTCTFVCLFPSFFYLCTFHLINMSIFINFYKSLLFLVAYHRCRRLESLIVCLFLLYALLLLLLLLLYVLSQHPVYVQSDSFFVH